MVTVGFLDVSLAATLIPTGDHLNEEGTSESDWSNREQSGSLVLEASDAAGAHTRCSTIG